MFNLRTDLFFTGYLKKIYYHEYETFKRNFITYHFFAR